MAERLFGVETEYAFAAMGPDSVPLDRERSVKHLMALARGRLPHLSDGQTTGMFLAKGSRLYIDAGLHPELATPECANPWDVVRYILAGEQILAGLAAELTASKPQIAEVALLKCNVDYSGTQSTWGCHESYLHKADPQSLPEEIIPHLISRLIYTGAGGFSSSRSHQFHYTLSPRVLHLVKVVSSASTRDRGIFHTKNESLCGDGHHRLHILCSESLSSETAMWLKTGVTALVVAMIEAGLRPGDAVQVARPLAAMHCFAQDETCTASVKGTQKKNLTAIEIQRHYLSLAETHVHEAFMPSWAGRVIEIWRAILDRLAQGAPDSVATVLDWAIKLSLYREWVQQSGMAWDNLERSSDLMHKLFETDARFGQLGEGGIFDAMDHAGVLAHRISGVDNIAHAVNHPPAMGRAAVRGRCVRRLSGMDGRYIADWNGIRDVGRKRFLDLSDPFETEERWQDSAKAGRDHVDGLFDHGRHLTPLEMLYAFGHTPEGFFVGDPVLLRRRDADGVERCIDGGSTADPPLGLTGTISDVVGIEPDGGFLVQVDVNGRQWIWRARNLDCAPAVPAVYF